MTSLFVGPYRGSVRVDSDRAVILEAKTNSMQQASLFKQDEKAKYKNDVEHSKDYCLKQIEKEPYLWDMRTWKVQREKATVEDVKQWVEDGIDNCGHCIYCINLLLERDNLSLEEVAKVVLKNKIVQFSQELGSWHNKEE